MNLVVSDQRGIGLPTGRTELLVVDFAEQLALVELDGTLQVTHQVGQIVRCRDSWRGRTRPAAGHTEQTKEHTCH